MRYPLAIKWVVGQVALGRDVSGAIEALTSSTGDVAKFCFEHIFNNHLEDDSKMVLYALASNDKPLVRGVLSHVSDLPPEQLDNALRNLTIASLIIPNQIKSKDDTIETKYELLPLTRNYIQSKLQLHKEIHRTIKIRTEMVHNLIEEADRVGKQYRYSLRDMGAESEEEKIAATLSFTAYQKYQAGAYDSAVDDFKRAAQIAPNFPAIYRNWATMESQASFFEKADELMQKATNLDPKDSRLWFVWGNIEKLRQRLDPARKYFNEALNLSPNDAPILGALGEVVKRKGYYQEADDLIRRSLDDSHVELSRRHIIINKTSLADNLRRWAQPLLRDKQPEEALEKLKEAYDLALEVFNLDNDDIRAKDTYLEVTRDLAMQLLKLEGIEKAMPYFNKIIIPDAKRIRERKVNEVCCFHIANTLLESGKTEEAKKYFIIGQKGLYRDSKYFDRYKYLNDVINNNMSMGILIRVVSDRGFGFIELEGKTGQTIFLHISSFLQKFSIDEFENMRGSMLSFVIEKDRDNRPVAKRACLVKSDE